jgi:hypothetical protein
MWERELSLLEEENAYDYNKEKRKHWASFIDELRNSYGKDYNEIIIKFNKSINKSIL